MGIGQILHPNAVSGKGDNWTWPNVPPVLFCSGAAVIVWGARSGMNVAEQSDLSESWRSGALGRLSTGSSQKDRSAAEDGWSHWHRVVTDWFKPLTGNLTASPAHWYPLRTSACGWWTDGKLLAMSRGQGSLANDKPLYAHQALSKCSTTASW